ncbi:hypothetical protein LY78DRAFT_237644 [Colletotrichum sublineola]|nr:hypothetical protein LY78DRAFT_237644 [Colletotrichum sublineola]
MARCLTQWSILGPRFPSLLSDESPFLANYGRPGRREERRRGRESFRLRLAPSAPSLSPNGQRRRFAECPEVWVSVSILYWYLPPPGLPAASPSLSIACCNRDGIPRVELDHLREGLFIPPFCPPSSLRISFRFTHTHTHPPYIFTSAFFTFHLGLS